MLLNTNFNKVIPFKLKPSYRMSSLLC